MPRQKDQPTGPRLLEIAIEHVRAHGIQRTTLTSIAHEAGVSHAAVYRYYASKDELIDAITAAWLKEVETTLVAVADAPDPADDKLERMVLALARALRDRLEREPNLYRLWLDAVEGGRLIVRRHRRRLNALFDRVIEDGASTDTFRGKSNEAMKIFVLDACHRFVDPHAVAADRDIPRERLDARLERVLGVAVRALGQRIA